MAGLAHAAALVGVEQEGGEGGFERGEAVHLEGGLVLQQELDEGEEILHVGPEEDGDAGEGGFGGVLAAFGEEAFADDDGGGEALPGAELAGGVDDEEAVLHGLRRGGGGGGGGGVARICACAYACACAGLEGAAEEGVQAEGGAELGLDLRGALDMARDDEEGEAGVGGAEALVDAGELHLLPGMGAGGEEEGLAGVDAAGVQEGLEGGHLGGVGRGALGVELDAAGVVDAVGGHAEARPAGDVLRLLDEHLVELGEDGADEEAEALKAPL